MQRPVCHAGRSWFARSSRYCLGSLDRGSRPAWQPGHRRTGAWLHGRTSRTYRWRVQRTRPSIAESVAPWLRAPRTRPTGAASLQEATRVVLLTGCERSRSQVSHADGRDLLHNVSDAVRRYKRGSSTNLFVQIHPGRVPGDAFPSAGAVHGRSGSVRWRSRPLAVVAVLRSEVLLRLSRTEASQWQKVRS